MSKPDSSPHESSSPVLPALRAFSPGTLIEGKYRVERSLGTGSMGHVLKAVDESLRRDVAIKVVLSRPHQDMLQGEAIAMARIRHENVVQIYAFGTHQDLPYFVMEYMDGGDLEEILERETVLQPVVALGLLEKMAAGLTAIHEQGVVHRDVKPGNVLIGKNYRVALTDFGLATAFAERDVVAGTPLYIAPEVIRHDSVPDELRFARDQYSLAVAAFEMLTGDAPFDAENVNVLLMKHCVDPIPAITSYNKALPPSFDAIFERALSKDPSERYPTCVAFSQALSVALAAANEPVPVTSKRVLVVNDDDDMRALYTAVLEETFPGVRIDEAEDGLVALELARAERPDLILLDINMPRLNGTEFVVAVYGEPKLKNVPICVVSAIVNPNDRGPIHGMTLSEMLRDLGVDKQLQKPVEPQQLIELAEPYLTDD